jgi:hypothetical protein
VSLHIRFRIRVGDGDLGHERRGLDVGPVGTHALVARHVRLLHLGVGDLDAVLDKRFHLLAQQIAAHLALELRGVDARLLELRQVALAGKAPVILESRNRLDAEPELLVADADALAPGLLADERLLDEVVGDLLGQAHAIGYLLRDLLPVDAAIVVDVVPLQALQARGWNVLAVYRDGSSGAGAVALHGARAVEEERCRDERDDHDQEDELQPPEILTHGSDQHRGLLGTFTSLPGRASSLPQAPTGT